jgi:hypothetical protein
MNQRLLILNYLHQLINGHHSGIEFKSMSPSEPSSWLVIWSGDGTIGGLFSVPIDKQQRSCSHPVVIGCLGPQVKSHFMPGRLCRSGFHPEGCAGADSTWEAVPE